MKKQSSEGKGIKITSVNGGTCCKCGEKNCNIVGGNIHQCKPTTKKTTKKQLFPKLFADIVDCAGRRMVNDMLNVKDKL